MKKTYTTAQNIWYSSIVILGLTILFAITMGLYKLAAIVFGFNEIINL